MTRITALILIEWFDHAGKKYLHKAYACSDGSVTTEIMVQEMDESGHTYLSTVAEWNSREEEK